MERRDVSKDEVKPHIPSPSQVRSMVDRSGLYNLTLAFSIFTERRRKWEIVDWAGGSSAARNRVWGILRFQIDK